jgi:hypothetical protein
MPPAGYASGDEKTWALIAHFGGAAGMFISAWLGWVAPLIALLAKGNQSPTVRAHAVAALNFQLLWSIIGAVGYIIGFCGSFLIIPLVFFLAPMVSWLLGTIFGIVAGVKANEGQLYRYPLSVRFVK